VNPGYLSWILVSISLILLASGWKRVLLGRIPDAGIFAFFAAWCILVFAEAEVGPGLKINLAVLPIAALFLVYLRRRRGNAKLLHLISACLFLASVQYFLKRIAELDPHLLPYDASLVSALAAALFALVWTRDPEEQIAGISFAALASHSLYWLSHREYLPLIPFGNMAFHDEWWLAAVSARAAAAMFAAAEAFVQRAAKNWNGRRKKVEEWQGNPYEE
jgi:hypothetical protein